MNEHTQNAETGTRLVDHAWDGGDDGHNCQTCIERDDALHMCWPQMHLCVMCETAAADWPDCMCKPCRAEVEAITDEVPDTVERLLSTHARMEPLCTEDRTMCRCGLSFSGGPGYHRRHVAELIYAELGVVGPRAWMFGERSPNRARFDSDGRIIPDDKASPIDGSVS